MKSTSVDGINATTPIDMLAVRVTRFKGEHYISNKQIQRRDRPTPIATRPFRIGVHAAKDYSGQRFGRFTVMGFHSPSRGNERGASWVVRCACGTYSTRRTKSITNPNNRFDCCDECQQLMYLQRQAMRRNGLPNATWDQVCS